jgi:ribosomal protein S18 acetylase RimI-like enzyme
MILPAMAIRPGTAADRDRLSEILSGTGRFTERELGWAMELVDAALLGGSEEYEVCVLEEEGATLGFALFGRTPRTDDVYDLYWLAVDQARQGTGLGQSLLQFVESELRARGARMLLIETSSKATYAPTVRFYEAAGYRQISKIKDFYRIEDDKLVFSKTLKP